MDFRDVTGTRWKMFYNQNQATSAARLKLFRSRAHDLNNSKTRKAMPPRTWRDVRYEKHHVIDKPNHTRDQRTNERIMLLDSASIGEDMGSAYDILNEHTYNYRGALGYYVDGYQHETMVGHVFKISTPKGRLYVPVTICNGWDGVTYWMEDGELVVKGQGSDEVAHQNALISVARAADSIAEREADEARDSWAKYEAEHEIEEKKEEISEIKKSISAAIHDLQHMKKKARKNTAHSHMSEEDTSICGRIVDDIREYVQDRQKLRKRIKKLEDEYWIVWNDFY